MGASPARRRTLDAALGRLRAAGSAWPPMAALLGGNASEPHFVRTYRELTEKLLQSWGSREGALHAAVGSATAEEYEIVGRVEKSLLVYAGLQSNDVLVDIGCGAGRLAAHLAGWFHGSYLGTDVVQTLLDYAAEACGRQDWRFEKVTGLTVPTASDSVDMVCAFSVFTHLRHEESYVYMQDIFRALKPGGRLVFSYLEFRVPAHWPVLEGNIASIGEDVVLNQFMSFDAIEEFAHHLGFELVESHRADELFIPMTDPSLDSAIQPELHSLGQSVAIYRKPA